MVDAWAPPIFRRSNRCEICNGEVEDPGIAIPYMDLYWIVKQGYDPFATGRLNASATSDTLMQGAVEAAKRSNLEDPMVGLLMAQSILAERGGAYESWKSRILRDEERLGVGWSACRLCAEDVAMFAVIRPAET